MLQKQASNHLRVLTTIEAILLKVHKSLDKPAKAKPYSFIRSRVFVSPTKHIVRSLSPLSGRNFHPISARMREKSPISRANPIKIPYRARKLNNTTTQLKEEFSKLTDHEDYKKYSKIELIAIIQEEKGKAKKSNSLIRELVLKSS